MPADPMDPENLLHRPQPSWLERHADPMDPEKALEDAHEAASAVGQYDDVYWGTSPAAEQKKADALHAAIDRLARAVLRARDKEWAASLRTPGQIQHPPEPSWLPKEAP